MVSSSVWKDISTAPKGLPDDLWPTYVLLRDSPRDDAVYTGYWDWDEKEWLCDTPKGKVQSWFPHPSEWAKIPK